MSASFPSVPGYIGPLSLKTFLEDFFFLKLTFGSGTKSVQSARSASDASRQVLHEVLLPINEKFLLVVYVARHAPTAPSPAVRVALQHPNNDNASNSSQRLLLTGTRTPFTHKSGRLSSCSVPLRDGNRFPYAATRGSTCTRSAAPAASWLLYTQAAHRPLTSAILQHDWWASLASLLGPAGVAFVELYCPVVVQLEAMSGGVQVLGPALHHAASLGVRIAAMRRWQSEKRKREEAGWTSLPRKVQLFPVRKQARLENTSSRTVATSIAKAEQQRVDNCGTQKNKAKSRHKGNCQPATQAKPISRWEAALLHTDVSRTRLYGVQVREDIGCISGDNASFDEQSPHPIPASLLEALWVCWHPRSLHCAVNGALPRWQVLRLQRASPESTCADSSSGNSGSDTPANAPLCLPFCYVKHVFRWMELTTPLSRDTRLVSVSTGGANHSDSFDVSAHLQHVLSTVLDQCRRFDLRGAALKHLSYLETRWLHQQQGKETPDIQRLAAPVDVVVAYLRTLLATLRWPFPTVDANCAGSPGSFWGSNDHDGSIRVMDAFFSVVRAWLSVGRHAIFPASRFLDGVPVAQLPWLTGFFTTATSKAPSAARYARRQRSQIQQRVWLQFVLFLTQDIIPFFVRSSFVVTWSSKNTNHLLFYPSSVWRRVVRAELRRSVSHRRSGRKSESNAESEKDCHQNKARSPTTFEGTDTTSVLSKNKGENKRLYRLASASTIDSREASASLTSGDGKPSLLYAGVRFRPDGRKLRPIAVLHSASRRSIKKMVRGTPSPYNHAAMTLHLLMRVVTWAGVTASPGAALALAWVRKLQGVRFERRFVALHRQRSSHHLLQPRSSLHLDLLKRAMQGAFRCLVSGAEAKRVQNGMPKLSNLSHQDEYAELRSFCEDARRCAEEPEYEVLEEAKTLDASLSCNSGVEGKAPLRVFLVRCDASRCYDNLPQERVLQEAHALVLHDAYRTLSFTVSYSSEGDKRHTASPLRSTQVSRTIPCEDVSNIKLTGIPRGHIYWETESKDITFRKGVNFRVLSGAAVRALLNEHLQRYLIVINGSVFEQHVGILQGSPMAMLLCDQLFAKAIDTDLVHVLSEHTERSLLLRRVDDVLIATTSSVAAQRCWQAMQRGWSSVGYRSNPKKLIMTTFGHDGEGNSSRVPWCGLLLHNSTLETSVEWRRMKPLLTSVCMADTHMAHRGDNEPLLFTQRLLGIVQLRMPPTVLCGRINSKGRQLQTFYEAALLWSRLIVWKVQETLFMAHHRCVAVLLLRPLAACIARLCRLLRRHEQFLRARQSGSNICSAEVRACVLTALHRTLQTKLRVLVSCTTRCAAARQERRDQPRGKLGQGTKTTNGIFPLSDSTSAKCQSTIRAFWWCAASRVESQWRGALASLERVRSGHKDAGGAQCSTVVAASLLKDAGPSSLHIQAVQATQPLFSHDTEATASTKVA